MQSPPNKLTDPAPPPAAKGPPRLFSLLSPLSSLLSTLLYSTLPYPVLSCVGLSWPVLAWPGLSGAVLASFSRVNLASKIHKNFRKIDAKMPSHVDFHVLMDFSLIFGRRTFNFIEKIVGFLVPEGSWAILS